MNQESSPCQRACCFPRQEVWQVKKVCSFVPAAFFKILIKRWVSVVRNQWVIATNTCPDWSELNLKALLGNVNILWRISLTRKGLKQHPPHADHPVQRATIKSKEISGPVVTSLTSHLFEPEQLWGLHLRWHDPSHPAQDLVASVGYTSGLLCGTMVHPHHHVLLSVPWRKQGRKGDSPCFSGSKQETKYTK